MNGCYNTLMKVDLHSIKAQAEELIEKYALTTPVHIFELADLLGIKWETHDTEQLKKIIVNHEPKTKESIETWNDVLGYYDSQSQTIYLNSTNQHITRKRFTMAHELGHVQLHHSLKVLLRKVFLRQDIVSPRDEVEAEANYFAGYLLMPDKSIKKTLELTILMYGGEEIITAFAKMFAVSPDAMRIRMKTFKSEHPELWNQYKLEVKLF